MKKVIDHYKIEVPWFLKFYKIVSDNLFYSVFHSIGLEAILEWTICIYLNLGKPIFSTIGEILSFIVSIFALVLIYIFIPGSMIYVYTRPLELLKNKVFEKRWGVLYEFISLRKKGALYFFIYYLLMRVTFFIVVFFVESLPL